MPRRLWVAETVTPLIAHIGRLSPPGTVSGVTHESIVATGRESAPGASS